MPRTQRWTSTGERACLVVFFCWLAFLPLPFGSNIEEARRPLIVVPLAICIMATLLRLYATRDRTNSAKPTRPWIILGSGALMMLAVVVLQLVPMPGALLNAISPESHAIWSAASNLALMAGAKVRTMFPITVDPDATRLELFRLAALFATFTAAALLVRTHARREVLAATVCAAATFEVLYAVREAALDRYAIWGWQNKLIFQRVTGTFVNPNHFGHYLAIALPLALFLAAVRWRRTGTRDTPLGRRLAALIETSTVAAPFALFAGLACVAGILLAQSRGALLALAGGLLVVAAMLPGKRAARIALGTAAGAAIIGALVLYLGPERTVSRLLGAETRLAGRRIALQAAAGVWQRFPVAGSGAGTFERVVWIEQREDGGSLYHHAHNDYAEIGATTGTLGFAVAMVTLFAGYVALVRMTFGERAGEITWSRRAFQVAALASLTIAMVHALVDFNFYIPSNPATLAAILGASVASLDHDKRTRL